MDAIINHKFIINVVKKVKRRNIDRIYLTYDRIKYKEFFRVLYKCAQNERILFYEDDNEKFEFKIEKYDICEIKSLESWMTNENIGLSKEVYGEKLDFIEKDKKLEFYLNESFGYLDIQKRGILR